MYVGQIKRHNVFDKYTLTNNNADIPIDKSLININIDAIIIIRLILSLFFINLIILNIILIIINDAKNESIAIIKDNLFNIKNVTKIILPNTNAPKY